MGDLGREIPDCGPDGRLGIVSAMRQGSRNFWAATTLVVILIALGGRHGLAQRAAPVAVPSVPAGQLWLQTTPLDDRQQLLLVVDPQLRTVAVYHVDGPTGAVVLKSTRNIAWDLMVGEFNAQEPKPAALRKMLEVGGELAPIGQTRP